MKHDDGSKAIRLTIVNGLMCIDVLLILLLCWFTFDMESDCLVVYRLLGGFGWLLDATAWQNQKQLLLFIRKIYLKTVL